ncbi:MAG: SigE family RNA polymerase sigma factor [Micropruina sp.]|uniref:SigE family RNA polymerase sigma factor n=1 Tax=Micropruina sp. TaxID=2737536 RepID=UPI0039E4F36B
MFGLSTAERDAEFVRFATEAGGSLKRTAFLLTGDRELAADLAQEALLRTYLAWRRVRTAEAAGYARRIVVNLTIDRWRRREASPAVTPDNADPYDAHRRVDDHDQAVRMLESLPPQQRRVIVLRYYNDLSEADTADCLGISVGAVKSAASRGLATLRTLYTPTDERGPR